MATARVIKSGKYQAVLLPKEFRVKCKELEIWRNGDEIVLREKKKGMERAFQLLASLPSDMFPEGRNDKPPQRRKGLWWTRARSSIAGVLSKYTTRISCARSRLM